MTNSEPPRDGFICGVRKGSGCWRAGVLIVGLLDYWGHAVLHMPGPWRVSSHLPYRRFFLLVGYQVSRSIMGFRHGLEVSCTMAYGLLLRIPLPGC